MHVLVKNLVTNTNHKCLASELYNLDTQKYEYSVFSPVSTTDFKKNHYYGSIINNDMVFNYILAMSEKKEEIEEFYGDPRAYHLSAAKRASIGLACEPLAKFKLVMERKDSKKDKKIKKTSVLSEKQSVEKSIVDKFHKNPIKKAYNVVAPNKDKENCGNISQKKDVKEKVGKPVKSSDSSAMLKQHVEHKKREVHGVDSNISERKRTLSNSLDVDEALKKRKIAQLEETCNVLQGKILNLEKENHELKDEVSSLKKERDLQAEHQSKLEKLQMENKILKKKLANLESDSGKQDVNLAAHLKEITDTIKGAMSVKGTCNLSKKDIAVAEEDEVKDGYINCGKGIWVLKDDVVDVELKSGKFATRLKGLCELFWPGKVHEKHLTSEGPSDSYIGDIHLKALTSILNTMSWDKNNVLSAYRKAQPKRKKPLTLEDIADSTPITLHVVRSLIRQTTYNAKETYKNSLLSREERLAKAKKKVSQKKDIKKEKDIDLVEIDESTSHKHQSELGDDLSDTEVAEVEKEKIKEEKDDVEEIDGSTSDMQLSEVGDGLSDDEVSEVENDKMSCTSEVITITTDDSDDEEEEYIFQNANSEKGGVISGDSE